MSGTKTIRALVLVAGILGLVSTPSVAAPTPAEEQAGEQAEAQAEPAPAQPPEKLKLFGVIQADYYAGDAGASGAADSSFFIRRARLGARGALTDRIDYRVMIALDGNNSDTVAGDVKTFDAYVDIALDERAKLRIGQYKYTFDREGRRSAAALPLITRARASNTLAGRLGQAGGAFRDVGVELFGTAGRWNYAVGVVNGNGINRRNNNDQLDAYLRASGKVAEGLDLGAGLFRGTSTVAGFESDEEILTADLLYERGDLALMAAFYAARYTRESGTEVEPQGFYAVGTYRVRPRVELALRYQEFEQDSNQPNRAFDSVDAGITYYFAPKGRWGGLKGALNYMARSAEPNAASAVWEERGATVVGGAGDVVLARLQVVF